ncbi:MAG: helix-turn-helix transcriptional regulator, partial [Pseudomonadota bacterium]
MQHRATGLRIREKRRELGVKQNALAARVGVSAAYLNLIESNKRGVGGALLAAIGKELGLTLDQLDGTAERRLRETLEEMARDPELAAPDLSEARPGATEEYIARYPAWARLTARLHGKWREATETAEAMSDRLSHDPALSAAVHAMLTEITALRSTSEILAEPDRPERPEMDAAQRRRFEQIMFEQSSRLAETGAALAAYFDEAAETRRRRTPAIDAEEALDALEDLDARIEDLAIDARARLGERAPDVASGDLVALLEAAVARPPDLPAEAGWLERRDALALSLARAFFAAEFGALIEDAHRAAGPRRAEAAAPADRTAPETEAAMRDELARRLADALTLPAERLLPLGRSLGWDVEALGRAVDG